MALKVGQIKEGKLKVVERRIESLDDTVMIRELSRSKIKDIYEDQDEDEDPEIKMGRLVQLVSASLTDEDGAVVSEDDAREMLEENSNPTFNAIINEILSVNGYEVGDEGES